MKQLLSFVIDQQEEEGLAVWGCWLDGPADIAVHELQWQTVHHCLTFHL